MRSSNASSIHHHSLQEDSSNYAHLCSMPEFFTCLKSMKKLIAIPTPPLNLCARTVSELFMCLKFSQHKKQPRGRRAWLTSEMLCVPTRYTGCPLITRWWGSLEFSLSSSNNTSFFQEQEAASHPHWIWSQWGPTVKGVLSHTNSRVIMTRSQHNSPPGI